MRCANISRGGRPVLKVPTSQNDVSVEMLSVVGVLVCFYIAARYWPLLPPEIPTHFNAAGRVDGWGSKSTIWLLPALTLLIYTGLTLAARFPHTFNYPVTITPENALREYTLGVRLMRWMKLEMVWVFAFLERMIVDSALKGGMEQGIIPVLLLLLVTVGTVVWFTIAMRRAR